MNVFPWYRLSKIVLHEGIVVVVVVVVVVATHSETNRGSTVFPLFVCFSRRYFKNGCS